MKKTQRILITGVTGFIGSHLQRVFDQAEYQIFGLLRSGKRISTSDETITYLTLEDIEQNQLSFDIIINLAGENIAGARWSKARKEKLRNSRIKLTEDLLRALVSKPSTIISMSAIGIYGTEQQQICDETMSGQSGFAYELCRDWEKANIEFEAFGSRVCLVRLGVVLGNGGALKQMLLPFKLGLGGKIATGEQHFPWIHIDDVIQLILFLLKEEHLSGVFNAVAPQTLTQQEFASSLATTLNRPCITKTPSWLLNLILGEMSSMLTTGIAVSSNKIRQAGFNFQYPEINFALESLAYNKKKL